MNAWNVTDRMHIHTCTFHIEYARMLNTCLRRESNEVRHRTTPEPLREDGEGEGPRVSLCMCM